MQKQLEGSFNIDKYKFKKEYKNLELLSLKMKKKRKEKSFKN